MLRIEMLSGDSCTVLRLMGRITSDEVQAVKGWIADASGAVALDLEQVALVDLDAARFLAAAERSGIELRRLPAYLHEWLRLEKARLGEME